MDEIRTPRMTSAVRLQCKVVTRINGAGGIAWQDLEEAGKLYPCEWKWAHGAEAITAGLNQLAELATLRLWAVPGLDGQCSVLREDGRRYELVSNPDDIGEHGQLIELKIKRMAGA